MKNGKLSNVLHMVLHLAEAPGPLTSDTLAKSAGTNPVVVRQLLAGLRKRGLVDSDKGHGGGWRLACDPRRVSLQDVYEATGSPALLALGLPDPGSKCRVERAVRATAGEVFHEAETLILEKFRDVTLAELLEKSATPSPHRHGGRPCTT